MDQRGDRRRAFHGVGQPGVQQELRRLAHRAHEQQQADQRQRVGDASRRTWMVLPTSDGACAKTVSKSIAPIIMNSGENAEREAEIADAVDDEGLDRRGVGFRLVIPEADQQIAREADAFPAEEQLHQVVGGHQHQHGEGEDRQIGEEARPVRVLRHVADGIEVHEAPRPWSPPPASPRSACRCAAPSRPSDRPTAIQVNSGTRSS